MADASDRYVAGESNIISGSAGGGLGMKKETGHQRVHLERNAGDYFDKPAAGPDDAIATPM